MCKSDSSYIFTAEKSGPKKSIIGNKPIGRAGEEEKKRLKFSPLVLLKVGVLHDCHIMSRPSPQPCGENTKVKRSNIRREEKKPCV